MRGIFIVAAIAVTLQACTDRDDMNQGARLRPLEPVAPEGPGAPVPDLPEGVVPRTRGPFEAGERPALTLDLLQRGRERFDTYCAPCHARDGYGDGLVVRHGFPQPPSLHDSTIRDLSDRHYFDVISEGLGKMPPYGPLVRPDDRWAIVDYVRALQLQQAPRREESAHTTP